MKNLKKILLHSFIFLLLLNFSLFAQESHRLRKDNEPFLLLHQKRTKFSFLLIHGFTGSAWEMRGLGQYLYNKGFNVYGMLLDGHGTKEEDLLKVKWEDWYQSVERSFEFTKLVGDEVIVVGFSTGGALALHMAANRPEVFGVVSLASAIFFQDWKINFSGIGKYFIKYNFRPLAPELKPYYYENRAVSAIYEVYKLSGVVRKELGNITQPVLIIQSESDGTIKPESAEYIYKNAGSKNKGLVILENCSHALVTFENPERNEVFEAISNWTLKLMPSP